MANKSHELITKRARQQQKLLTAESFAPCAAHQAQVAPSLHSAALRKQRSACDAAQHVSWHCRQRDGRHASTLALVDPATTDRNAHASFMSVAPFRGSGEIPPGRGRGSGSEVGKPRTSIRRAIEQACVAIAASRW